MKQYVIYFFFLFSVELTSFGSNFHLQHHSENNTLMFNPVSEVDDGSYVCEIDNGIGNPLNKTARLIVHGTIYYYKDS